MTTDIEIPERIPVIIGKNVFQMESESLIASLVHQTIHKNNLLYNSDDFGMIFETGYFLAIVFVLGTIFIQGMFGLYSLVGVSFCMSLILTTNSFCKNTT